MPANNIRNLIDSLVACDEQPSEEQMTELRKVLEQKVTRMKKRGRYALYAGVAAIALLVLGYAMVAIAAGRGQDAILLTTTGHGALVTGAILAVIAAIGHFVFRGFSYVWARQELHDAALMELSLQVRRLAERLDAQERSS